jgi:hypothetical protein
MQGYFSLGGKGEEEISKILGVRQGLVSVMPYVHCLIFSYNVTKATPISKYISSTIN